MPSGATLLRAGFQVLMNDVLNSRFDPTKVFFRIAVTSSQA
jgi:hypothetical protein